MTRYSVVVGNIGKVYDGDSEEEALHTFQEYIDASKAETGRASNEPVNMFKDSELVKEYNPPIPDSYINDWRIKYQAEHEQYWQGHGISNTKYTHTSVGSGRTIAEAFDDALDYLAQGEMEISDELRDEMRRNLESQVSEGLISITVDSDISVLCEARKIEKEKEDHEDECAICGGDWNFYVCIDLQVVDREE